MWLFNRSKRDTEPVVEPQVSDVLLRALLTGEPITRQKAMTLPAVSAAVDFITSTVACMPVRLYKRAKGVVEEVENDSRVKMLNGDTGDTLDGYQLKKAMVEDYLLGKGGYCYIQRSRNDVTGLYYVATDNVSININADPIHKDYDILVGADIYKPFEFVKLLRNTKDGASGIGLTVEVSKALETAYQTLVYQLSLVKAGGSKRGFLKANRKLGQEEIDTLKNAWARLYANSEENVVVLNNGLDFQEASSTSTEMQLNENKQTLAGEINGIFHIKDSFEETYKCAIYPIICAFETALNRDLLLESEKKKYYFAFDSREIIKASLKERYEVYQLAKQCGLMTINEMRKAENMNTIEGMDILNLGLDSVLYNTQTGVIYTPNTDSTKTAQSGNQLEFPATNGGTISAGGAANEN
nr:MAG TPA: portal protein [Caudoviricetes sp.]